jgi:UrcA family protein
MTISQTPFRFTPLIGGLAAVALSLAGGNAHAASQENDAYSVKVQYNPAELSTQAGTQKIYGKIKSAARRVCSTVNEPRYPARMRQYRQCYETALSNGVDDVNSKNLTALHQQGTKQKHPG